MRGNDHVDGKLVSLDVGNLGDNDMGVKIQFQNVWFRYPTRDVPILNGLNLTVSGNHLDGRTKTDTLVHRLRRDSLRPLLGHQVCHVKLRTKGTDIDTSFQDLEKLQSSPCSRGMEWRGDEFMTTNR
jgi:hypothetical protein